MIYFVTVLIILILWKVLVRKNNNTDCNITRRSDLPGYIESPPSQPCTIDVCTPAHERWLVADTYYKGLEKIEERYSVLYNMGIIDGSEVDIFIGMCKQNIREYRLFVELLKKEGLELPLSVPAYKRLAMVYEKQARYEEAISICAEAIRMGAVDDGTKGRMRGRLARLIRKYNGDVPQNILRLLD